MTFSRYFDGTQSYHTSYSLTCNTHLYIYICLFLYPFMYLCIIIPLLFPPHLSQYSRTQYNSDLNTLKHEGMGSSLTSTYLSAPFGVTYALDVGAVILQVWILYISMNVNLTTLIKNLPV